MFLMDRFFDGAFLTFGLEVIAFADSDGRPEPGWQAPGRPEDQPDPAAPADGTTGAPARGPAENRHPVYK